MWRSILAGAFGLIVLEVLVSNAKASGAVGGVLQGVGTAVSWFTDPTKPGIPQRATTASATTSSTSSPLSAQQAVNAVPTPGGTGTGYNPNTLA